MCCVWGLLFEPLHTYLWCWALCTTFKCGHVEQLQNMHVFDETTYKRTLLKHKECHTDALPHMPEFCFKSNIIFCVNQILTEISTAAAQSSLPPCFYSIFIIMAKEWMRKQMQRTLVFSKNQTKSFETVFQVNSGVHWDGVALRYPVIHNMELFRFNMRSVLNTPPFLFRKKLLTRAQRRSSKEELHDLIIHNQLKATSMQDRVRTFPHIWFYWLVLIGFSMTIC